jgi:hypothetical protein
MSPNKKTSRKIEGVEHPAEEGGEDGFLLFARQIHGLPPRGLNSQTAVSPLVCAVAHIVEGRPGGQPQTCALAPGTDMAQDARPTDAIAAAARTDPAETQGTSRASSRAAAAFRAERGRIATHFLQAFPNLGYFSPSFSKQSFGGFVGFQWVARSPFPNFSAASASFRPRYWRSRAMFGSLAKHGLERNLRCWGPG